MNPQFITDIKGVKLSVILPIKDFEAIMEELEELEDIKLYDEAVKCTEPSIPIDEAFKMIEQNRQK
ncbi:MAG: hypothetical protein IPM42_08800 [Saprospiraceae bacterium]|nr:hypothetical protein [Saprospiraceae bacterium]